MSRGRGRWERVLNARRQSCEALALDPNQGDLFDAPPKKRSAAYVPISPAPIEQPTHESIYVLTLGEPAARLGVSRAELEAMIAAGKIKALPTSYTRTIQSTDVERLLQAK